jgi:hypothetical protein
VRWPPHMTLSKAFPPTGAMDNLTDLKDELQVWTPMDVCCVDLWPIYAHALLAPCDYAQAILVQIAAQALHLKFALTVRRDATQSATTYLESLLPCQGC